jgi:hypothetical protein
MGAQAHGGTKTIRALKRAPKEQLLVRGLFLGLKTRTLAKRLGLTPQTIRDWSSKPEIQTALDVYTRRQFEAMDRHLPYMLKKTQTQLIRLLRRGDFEAIKLMCADTGLIRRLMDHQLEKLAAGSPSSPRQPSVSVEVVEADTGMSDEVRQKSRELLQLMRKALPGTVVERVSPDIPARMTAIHSNGTNGTGPGSP